MEISYIKTHLAITDLVLHYGHKPSRNNLIRCPFHEDGKASLQLYPKTGTWHCFGCNKGTDQMDFIRLTENCTPHEAIKKAGLLLTNATETKPQSIQQPVKELPTAERTQILTSAFTYFIRSINYSDLAKAYLQQRVLDHKKTTVGYDGGQFHHKAGKEAIENYLSSGLLKPYQKGQYYSFFKDCLVFATLNEKGEIVNLYGRHTEKEQHRYLPGKHQGLYPKYPKADTEILIITESIIDAATLLQLLEITRKYEIMSLYGVNNFTEEHRTAIKNLHRLKEVILFYDGDKAGQDAIKQHTEIIQQLRPGVKISYIETTEGEDINSLAQGHEPTIFLDLIENRKLFLSEETKEKQNVIPMNEKNKSSEPLINTTIPTSHKLNTDNPEQLIYENEWLTITLWGGIDLYNVKKLRATLHLQSKNNDYIDYRDTVDLYSYSSTQRLTREGGEKLEIGSTIMGKTITALTKELEQYRQRQRDKQQKKEEEERKKNQETFTTEQMQAGKGLLEDPALMERTSQYIHSIGLVGEETNGMLLFFILLTRMFKEPLHALVQGKSGSGKTYLLKKIAGLVPKAQIRIATALTENTLYHSMKGFWKHMILLIEDLDGALNALFPLREMMSNQSISKLSTEKDIKTGEFKQMMLYVEGPVCVAGATTKDKIYEDNANRSFLLQVNEGLAHQEKVLDYQRKELSGLMDRTGEYKAATLMKAAQLQLAPLEVVIPFGEQLRIPDYVFKKLRTNAHYLTLIKAIAFWHQRQREIKQKIDGTKYIEATLEDVYWANELSRDVLLRKGDELNGSLRNFFESLKSFLKIHNQESFYSKSVRERLRMHPMQVNRYLHELDQRGYIKLAGGNRKTGFEYKIQVWDDYEILKQGTAILDTLLAQLKAEEIKGGHPMTNRSLTEV